MKRKIMLIAVLALISSFLSAAPFGLKMGMNLDEITEACGGQRPKNEKDDCYRISPEKKHPLFEEYYAYVDDLEGLYYIKAVSYRISTNQYGTELKEKFYEISNRIAKTYGTPGIVDEIDKESIFREESYWFYSLGEGARTLSARWETKEPMKDNLAYVYLYVSAGNKSYSGNGYVNLEYRFTNANAVEDSQDDVF